MEQMNVTLKRAVRIPADPISVNVHLILSANKWIAQVSFVAQRERES